MKEFQKQRIMVIEEILPNIKNCVLKGGTSLLLYYNLDRFSEDIDLDSISSNPNISNDIEKIIKEKNWNYRIAKNIDTVFRVMIDYGGKSDKGDYPLKLEVSSRNSKLLKKGLLKFTTINGVNVYTVEELIRMKCSTFSQRDKIRDLYDIGYLLKTFPKQFTQDNLKTVYQNINHKGVDELAIQLGGEIRQNLLTDIDAETYILELLDNCENMMVVNNEMTHRKLDCFQENKKLIKHVHDFKNSDIFNVTDELDFNVEKNIYNEIDDDLVR